MMVMMMMVVDAVATMMMMMMTTAMLMLIQFFFLLFFSGYYHSHTRRYFDCVISIIFLVLIFLSHLFSQEISSSARGFLKIFLIFVQKINLKTKLKTQKNTCDWEE